MPTELLPPNTNLYVNFSGSRRGRTEIVVEASGPITVYVTTSAGVMAYRDGDAVNPIFAHERDTQWFEQNVQLRPNTSWSLLMINTAEDSDDWDDACAVHYEVYAK